MMVHLDAVFLQLLFKRNGRSVGFVKLRNYDASDVQSPLRQYVHNTETVFVVGDSYVGTQLVFSNVCSVDYDDDFHLVLDGGQHPNLAVRLKSRQNS